MMELEIFDSMTGDANFFFGFFYLLPFGAFQIIKIFQNSKSFNIKMYMG